MIAPEQESRCVVCGGSVDPENDGRCVMCGGLFHQEGQGGQDASQCGRLLSHQEALGVVAVCESCYDLIPEDDAY